MSPVRVAEHHVTSEDGDGAVRVKDPENNLVEVVWFCGDSVTFSKDALREAAANVDRVKGFKDLNLTLTDTHGRAFSVRVVDGELYADWSVTSLGTGRHVPWEDLRKVLRKAAG